MARLFFIRHAESHANADGAVLPNADIPLSPQGRAQAHELAERLSAPVGPVFVSTYLRTQETAAPWCEKHGIRAVKHPLTHEFSIFDHRLIAGMNAAQRRPLTEQYWAVANVNQRCGEAAETFAEFVSRVDSFIQEMESMATDAVCFGHGIWIALLIWRLRGQDASDGVAMRTFRQFQLDLPMPNCAIWHLDRTNLGDWVATQQ